VTQQPGFNVCERQRFAQQGIVEQVDLPRRHVIGGTPPGVDPFSSAADSGPEYV